MGKCESFKKLRRKKKVKKYEVLLSTFCNSTYLNINIKTKAFILEIYQIKTAGFTSEKMETMV